MNSHPRIAIFGGTFDPIHEGHLEIAQRAQQEMALTQVIFLPCRQSPHKSTGPAASDQHRLKMLQLATADLPWATVSDFELHRPLPNYTYQTLAALKPTFPEETQLFLLIGLDQWTALPKWSHPEKLAQSLEFIVFGRDGSPSPRDGYHAHFFPSQHPASATQIRKSIATSTPPSWLHPDNTAYIAQHQLYRPIP